METSAQFRAPVTLPPEKRDAVSTEQEARLTPVPLWTLWGRAKSLSLSAIEKHNPSAVQPSACQCTDQDGPGPCQSLTF